MVNILDTFKVQKVQVLENPFESNNLYSRFYNGIKSGIISNDEQAIKYLYKDEIENNKNYARLKHRFKRKMLDSLFLIDTNKPYYTDAQKAYYNCYKNLARINILLAKGAKSSAIEICINTLRIALKFEITEIASSVSKVLRRQYAISFGDKKKFEEYNQIYHEQQNLFEVESKAEELFSALILDIVGSIEQKKETQEKARDYSKQLEKYKNKIFTQNFVFFSNYLELLGYESANDYDKMILVCNNALNILTKKKFNLKVRIYTFLSRAFYANLKLCRYSSVELLIESGNNAVDIGSINWFKFNELYFIYLMRIDQYSHASEILEKIITHKRFKFQDNDTKEVWKLLEAYAFLLQDDQEEIGKFRVGKFINDVPVFSKDKRGLNICIIIAQILILIKQEKYNQVIDKAAGLERYNSRYLNMHNTYRVNCFIKMLLQVEKRSFHPIAIQRHTEKYMKKLQEVPLHKSEQPLHMEIVPYETLWQSMLKTLMRQQKLEV
ncbi:MAG: hypothetical protein AAGK97_00405 [Bacteroidota bacterium]